MAVFYDSVGNGAVFDESIISFPIPMDCFWWHQAPAGRQTAVVVAVSYWVTGASLSDLTRRCWYGAMEMQSLGYKAWASGSSNGWVEMFGILNPPKGRQIVHAWINGGLPFVGKQARANSVSYTGVDGFGAVTNAAGSGSGSLSVSSTGNASTRIVTAFGSNVTGFTGYNRTQRSISNTAMALAIGDAAGTGASDTVSVSRVKSGPWAAMSVVLNAADIVATATGVTAAPMFTSAGRRYPRPGTNRRTRFTVEPED
jgi:hypothetical protein